MGCCWFYWCSFEYARLRFILNNRPRVPFPPPSSLPRAFICFLRSLARSVALALFCLSRAALLIVWSTRLRRVLHVPRLLKGLLFASSYILLLPGSCSYLTLPCLFAPAKGGESFARVGDIIEGQSPLLAGACTVYRDSSLSPPLLFWF